MAKKIHIIEKTGKTTHEHTVHDASDPRFQGQPGGLTIKQALEHLHGQSKHTRKVKRKEAGDAD